ncbi:MAG: YggS family pyridoxal phosphate-dependent enzyme [Actinomycetota bacterium]|nr:YggS family pyridoxal phosphate-dependent enzyme [Actinomycetota bacterium]
MTVELFAERLSGVRQRIADVGVDPDEVEVVAVTKGFDADAVAVAIAAGLRHLGENYATELIDKAVAYPDACWHFLGPLQRNKAARLAPLVSVWEAVDRSVAADAIAGRAPGAAVYIQINVTGEANKAGCAPGDTDHLIDHSRKAGLEVRGLMAVGPAGDRQGSRACFKIVAGLARSVGLRSLSMGMSDDFDIAVDEGATTIRLGRALFGPRPITAHVRR